MDSEEAAQDAEEASAEAAVSAGEDLAEVDSAEVHEVDPGQAELPGEAEDSEGPEALAEGILAEAGSREEDPRDTDISQRFNN